MRSTKAAQAIQNVSTLLVLKLNDNNDTNTIETVIRGNKQVEKRWQWTC